MSSGVHLMPLMAWTGKPVLPQTAHVQAHYLTLWPTLADVVRSLVVSKRGEFLFPDQDGNVLAF